MQTELSETAATTDAPQTATRRLTLVNVDGICLRTASLLSETASAFTSVVRVRCGERSANPRSIMELLGLQAKTGMELELEATGSDCWKAIAAMTKLIKYGF